MLRTVKALGQHQTLVCDLRVKAYPESKNTLRAIKRDADGTVGDFASSHGKTGQILTNLGTSSSILVNC